MGLGLNEAELDENDTLAEWHVRDLNAQPALPFPGATFDHAVCCVSVDYLTLPLAAFREVARVLRPGGLFVVTFSNRRFPTKAIRGWLERDGPGRVALVERYFALAGGFAPATSALRAGGEGAEGSEDNEGGGGDPLYGVWASRSDAGSDPDPDPDSASASASATETSFSA